MPTVTIEVQNPRQFAGELRLLRGTMALLNGLVAVLGHIEERTTIDLGRCGFDGATELTEHALGTLFADEMDDLLHATEAVASAEDKERAAEQDRRVAASEGGAR